MRAAFVINARDKEKHVYKAVEGALAQTYPCEIILSDQHSTDTTFEQIQRAVAEGPRGAEHTVRILRCPIEGRFGMAMGNAHFDWIVDQTEAEWIFQCSADDYSLPDRVKVCMEAVDKNNCVAVATTMRILDPQHPEQEAYSGFPTQTGYVRAGEGIARLAFGSCIAGYRRDWLKRVGGAGRHTMDVYYGYLAALDAGYYAVANPQHVHVMHAAAGNMGFGGKLRASVEGTDDNARLNELNRFQLLDLYFSSALRAQELYPLAKGEDTGLMLQMILTQAKGWLDWRNTLHERGITPGII